jgi:hypothetical protein
MAGKAIIPFIEASSTFALEGEHSPVNLALAAMEVDQEAEHIAKTPLAVVPAPASKETPGGSNGVLAEPLVRPNHHGSRSASLSTPHAIRKISCQERQAPGIMRFCTADYRDVGDEGHLQAPL